MRYEVEIDVEAPPETVWRVLADPTRWPLISDSFLKVTLAGGGPDDHPDVAVGAVYTVRQPNVRAMRWRVTEVEEGRGFSWRSSVLGVTSTGSHEVVHGPTGSRLCLALLREGLLARPVSAMGGTHYRALLDREAATLAGAAEHRARG